MSFSTPRWSSVNEIYTIKITSSRSFEYSEIRQTSGANLYTNPAIDSSEFIDILENIANQINIQGKSWFASPIKPALFLKRVRHIFMKAELPEKNYGKTYLFTWSPYVLNIHSNYYELMWNILIEEKDDILPSNSIEFSAELDEPVESKTRIIQSNPAELCELELVENDSTILLNTMKITSRAAMKKKIRETRLKAAVLALKAEKLAEKYFRRYGNLSNIGYESDLSLNSDEEENEDSETQ